MIRVIASSSRRTDAVLRLHSALSSYAWPRRLRRGCRPRLAWSRLRRSAQSGEEGCERGSSGAYDVLVTDLRMGSKDGIDVLRVEGRPTDDRDHRDDRLRCTIESAVEAMRYGAFDYNQAVHLKAELLVKVGKALDNRRLAGEVAFLASEFKDRYKKMAAIAGALVVNLGTISSSWARCACVALIERAAEPGHPGCLIRSPSAPSAIGQDWRRNCLRRIPRSFAAMPPKSWPWPDPVGWRQGRRQPGGIGRGDRGGQGAGAALCRRGDGERGHRLCHRWHAPHRHCQRSSDHEPRHRHGLHGECPHGRLSCGPG